MTPIPTILPLARSARIASLAAIFSLPLVGGLAFAFWPGTAWHSGPTPRDIELEVAPVRVAPLPGPGAWPPATAAVEAELQPATVSRNLLVASGDTLMDLLTRAGIERQEAFEAITALSEVFSPRRLRPGQEIRLSLAALEPEAGSGRLLSLSLQPDVERDIRVSRRDGAAFVAEAIERPLLRRAAGAGGIIDSNLSVAAQDAGLPAPVMIDLIRLFSFDVDFQRELQVGDSFEVLYNALFEIDGELAKSEDILYAALTLSGKRLELYRFTPKSGETDFFDTAGQSVRRTLLRTPVDGARLSSRFGMRKHPILGYSRMHRGIDFAAPSGTPIYAAGDGVIELAGRNGAYGNYVRIRHNSTYKTAYAHMSRFAKGTRRGGRVRQGEVIGYVGSTGRSTGPHLHYEVLIDGRQVNPMKIKLASGEKLKGEDLERFAEHRTEIDRLRGTVAAGTQVVDAGCLTVAGGPEIAEAAPAC